LQIANLEAEVKINEVELLKSFPIGYAAQPLNWGDDGFQRLSVQFAYNGFVNVGNLSANVGLEEAAGDARVPGNQA
jgi:hypothetical protein